MARPKICLSSVPPRRGARNKTLQIITTFSIAAPSAGTKKWPRALAEQAAKQVRHLKRKRESAGHPGVAHERGINHLARQTEHATGEGGGGERARGSQHLRHRARRLRFQVPSSKFQVPGWGRAD